MTIHLHFARALRYVEFSNLAKLAKTSLCFLRICWYCFCGGPNIKSGAGRPWSKTFTDPNKVFVGNLPYDADEADEARLFADHWNISEEAVGDRRH